MTRQVVNIPDGSVIVDCVTRITTPALARALKADGVAGVIQYVGRMSAQDPGLQRSHVDAILSAGLGFLGMCFADQFDGAERARAFGAAGALPGLSLGTDLESYRRSADLCELKLNACARDIEIAGFLPYLYVGSGQPLDAGRLGRLVFTRYHRSASDVPTPTYAGLERGWSLVQHLGDPASPRTDWRQVYRGGVNVDLNTAQADPLGRRLTWLVDLP